MRSQFQVRSSMWSTSDNVEDSVKTKTVIEVLQNFWINWISLTHSLTHSLSDCCVYISGTNRMHLMTLKWWEKIVLSCRYLNPSMCVLFRFISFKFMINEHWTANIRCQNWPGMISMNHVIAHNFIYIEKKNNKTKEFNNNPKKWQQ